MKAIHLPGLNGLRAIAAIAVVLSHTLLLGVQLGLPANQQGTDLAGFGVSIFFSLSGFLITFLLLKEKKQFARINIRAFYMRRILRIWPLYYLYLILVLLCLGWLGLERPEGSIWFYLFLCANIPFILGAEIPLLGHYWSLGVEEQFYLFWPWIVSKVRSIRTFLIWFIVCFLFLKAGFRLLDMYKGISIPYLIVHVTRFECMAIGALGAVFCVEENALFNRIVRHRLAQVLAWLAILLMAFNRFHVISMIDNDLVDVITVVLIINVALNPQKLIGLENRVCDFLGRISFGIYVYHPLLIMILGKFAGSYLAGLDITLRYTVAFTAVLLTTILVAWLSYELYEKKILRLKVRYAPVPSSADKQ